MVSCDLQKRKASFQKPTMTQPFNPDGFTKVKESEVLARVYVKDRKVVFVRDVDLLLVYYCSHRIHYQKAWTRCTRFS